MPTITGTVQSHAISDAEHRLVSISTSSPDGPRAILTLPSADLADLPLGAQVTITIATTEPEPEPEPEVV